MNQAQAKHTPTIGVDISLRIGQRVRHRDYQGRRVTGVVRGLSVDDERALVASVALDEPIVIPACGDQRELHIHWQTAPVHEFAPFDDRDELLAEMLSALRGALESMETGVTSLGVIRAARAVIAKATGAAS